MLNYSSKYSFWFLTLKLYIIQGIDLIKCLKNYGWRFVTLYRRQGSRPFPRKRNAKRQMAVWGGLINSYEKKRSEKQRRKRKIYPFEFRVPKNSKDGFALLSSYLSFSEVYLVNLYIPLKSFFLLQKYSLVHMLYWIIDESSLESL